MGRTNNSVAMIEDYANYELSKALKACGFDEPCDSYYYKACASDDECWYTKREEAYNWNGLDSDCQISAPSLYAAQKWLREKHNISVRVSYIAFHKVWFADWLNLDSGEFDDTDATFATYEEALSDGIAAALELIKKGE